ncbi:MAG: c-type cytochrome [Pseudomonadota bacterium]|jgi:sulfide dehydrogenase cytochrome subunit
MKLKLIVLLGGMALSPAIWAAGPTPAMLSNTCAGCHGTNGISAGPNTPTLAGQPAAYLVESMKKFKSGERPSSIMGRLARGYTDADFAAMAEFFSKREFVPARQKFDAAKAAEGELLHQQNCRKCHTEGGSQEKDNEEDSDGILAGQWKEYLDLALDEFRSGKRPTPDKMADKIRGLSREQLDALTHYYASRQ